MRRRKMKMYKSKDVDSYIANSGREARSKLKEIREIIKSTIPKVGEGISWACHSTNIYSMIQGKNDQNRF